MPKQLFICRHAEAADPAGQLPDFERNLTASGISQARKTGTWLRAHFQVQAIVASPARRTRQTAEIISEMAKPEQQALIFKDRLYNAPTGKIIQTITELPNELNKVILVGHNPGISQVIAELTNTDPGYLEPANLAMLSFDTDAWEEIEFVPGKLQEIFRPEK